MFRSVELGLARAELARASAVRETAETDLERQQRLRDEGIGSERSLLEAQRAYDEADAARDAARARIRIFGVRGGSGSDMSLTSPIDGVVIARHATRGENVSPDDTLFVIADPSRGVGNRAGIRATYRVGQCRNGCDVLDRLAPRISLVR